MEKNPHNVGHNWIGPWMKNCRTSPSDPVFWVFHTNYDRLWARWQYLFNRFSPDGSSSSYFPLGKFADMATQPNPCDVTDPNECVPIGHRIADTMWPWNGGTNKGSSQKGSWPQRNLAEPFLIKFRASGVPALWPESTAVPTPGDMIDFAGITSGRLDMGFAYDDTGYGSQPPKEQTLTTREKEGLATFLDSNKPTAARVAASEEFRHTDIGAENLAALRKVFQARNQDDAVRIEAMRILGDQGDVNWVTDALTIVRDLADGGAALDAEAIELLGAQMMFAPDGRSKMETIMPILQSALKDERPQVRLAALRNLAPIGDHEAVAQLTESLRNPAASGFSPLQAIQGLVAAHVAGDSAALIRPFMKDHDPAVRSAAVSALSSDPRSRDEILAILSNRQEQRDVRSTALQVLSHAGVEAARLALKIVIDPNENLQLRGEAVSALGTALRTAGSKLAAVEAAEVADVLSKLGKEDAARIGPVVEKVLQDAQSLTKQRGEK